MKLVISKVIPICLSLSLLWSPSLFSKAAQTFEVYGKKVAFELPKDWQSVNKKIGVPLKLIGPSFEGKRPIITFVPIDLKNEKIVLDNAKKAEESYKVSRTTWLQKFNGRALNFDSVKVYSEAGKEIHRFGYSYAFNNENYNELSYYVRCNNNTYHMKSLVKLEHGKKWDRVVLGIINSFECN